jgi:predicted phage baseplate assembly protein
MPILPPSLDDRRFDDLVEDLLNRIPAHTPEWTHPRLGDPGRSLIELFAWLGDTLLYRANLIPERQRLVFLKLLGMGLRPAQPARGIVALGYAQSAETSVSTLAAGCRVKNALPFETLSETSVLPVTAECYIKRRLSHAETARKSALIEGLKRIHRVGGELAAYQTTPLFSEGEASSGGIDVFADSADRALWIALLAPRAAQPDGQPALNANVVAAIGGGDSGSSVLLSIGVVPALRPADSLDDAGIPAPVPVAWEIATRGRSNFETAYLALGVQPGSDSSGGLAATGTLRLALPASKFIWTPANDVGVNPGAGVGDAPPRLDDPARAARVVAWLRLRPKAGERVNSLKLSWLGINAVAIDQRTTLAGKVLGVSNGAPDQVFRLPQGSVDADSLLVEVEESGRGYRPWQRVDDLAALSPDSHTAREARAFELDAEAGTLRFGDGLRGRIPEAQMRVRLKSGRFGGGAAGNLPPGTLTAIDAQRIDGKTAPQIKVSQPVALTGGADAETLQVAEKRIPGRLRHGDRAVTEEDYRRLALDAPGTDIGRIAVLPRFNPHGRRSGVPGAVSVVALPAAALAPAPNPRPDRPFIERLHNHLAPRVPLATELYVIGCEYVGIGVSVAVAIRDGYARDAVLLEVREALRRLLWPLAPGGLDGDGWALGRSVRSRELEVEVSRVAGVDEVRGLHVFLRQGDAWKALPKIAADGAQSLALHAWQLPELLSVVAVDGPDAGNLDNMPNPFAAANAVAVPVVPDLC